MEEQENSITIDEGLSTPIKNETKVHKKSFIGSIFEWLFRVIKTVPFYFELITFLLISCIYTYVIYKGIGKFIDLLWMAKANDYQSFPMDRIKKQSLKNKEYVYYQKMDFSRSVKGYEHLCFTDFFEVQKISNVEFSEEFFQVKNLNVLDKVTDESYKTFFLPIPLNDSRKTSSYLDNPWYYFEVELVDLPEDQDFVIGMMEFPNLDIGDQELEIELKNDWSCYIKNCSSPYRPFNYKPGQYPNSIGFYLKSGNLFVSNSVEHTFNMDKIFEKMKNPKRMFELNDSNNEKEDSIEDEDSEMYDYSGDSIGLAYNCITGQIYITLNGQILNKADPKIATEVNLQLFLLKQEENKKVNYEKEMEELNGNAINYFKKLNLEPKIYKGIRDVPDFRVSSGLKYLPVVLCGPQTRFNINVGSSAFRNGQPEFSKGLLTPYKRQHHKDPIPPQGTSHHQ